MRKLISILVSVMICITLVLPAYAAENEFVPSITYKPVPDIIPVEDGQGQEATGVLRDADGNIIDYVYHGCLLITPIAHVWDDEIAVPEDVERLLTFVYEQLTSNNMEIPYDKHEQNLNSADMVIRDLFDVRWVCEEHRALFEQDGVTFEITFDLGVVSDTQIFVMTYDEDTNEWSPIVKSVNNGDGTVTCTFDHFCAVEFSMAVTPTMVPSDATSGTNLIPYIITLILAVVAAIFIIAKKRKKVAV